MRTGIGSVLTVDALATLAAGSAGDEIRRRNFYLLTRPAQISAIRGLAESGMSDGSIARATGLSIDMICRLLANAREASPSPHRELHDET